MTWTEFRSLLQGLGPDTPLARTVQIRLENDKDILKNFSSAQHKIRNKWRSKQSNQHTQEELNNFLVEMQAAFAAM